ncbi:MAG: YqgE/AlgH family protein [Anderseniella sp.]
MSETYLDGKLLVAMPGIGDDRFSRSVIFMCAHSGDGAMGLIINQEIQNLSFSGLMERLALLPDDEAIRLPQKLASMPVLQGGPVETSRGFVLHSRDYFSDECTLDINGNVGLTATLDVLRAIAAGKGPQRSLLALGYAGWGPGQLEAEIKQNGWLYCEPDDSLLFDQDVAGKYTAALSRIGVNEAVLSTGQFGHA